MCDVSFFSFGYFIFSSLVVFSSFDNLGTFSVLIKLSLLRIKIVFFFATSLELWKFDCLINMVYWLIIRDIYLVVDCNYLHCFLGKWPLMRSYKGHMYCFSMLPGSVLVHYLFLSLLC